MTDNAHSLWSASKFDSLMACPGKVVLESGLPDTTNAYASEGTAAHMLLTVALQTGRTAASFIGEGFAADGTVFVVDDEMARFVQVTVDYIKGLQGDKGELFVDERVNYATYLETPAALAFGTADAIVVLDDEIIAVDFKYGMGVEVSAECNAQTMLYALGALQAYNGVVADFKKVRMAISQPRLSITASEYSLSVEALERWGYSTARSAVAACQNAIDMRDDMPRGLDWAETFLHPGESQCRFCKAKPTCPALRATSVALVLGSNIASPDEFELVGVPGSEHIKVADDKWLATVMAKASLIEGWVTAVRAEVERRLLAGGSVPGFKLVQGKRGNRSWTSAIEAEKLLKTMKLKVDEMYELKLISPTTAEKLSKDSIIGPRQWPKLLSMITQKEGKPSVAPVSDPRPVLTVTPVVDDFQNVTDELA